ncbi:MAG: site-specific DNA-methyltransferase [Acidimicrobiales bacterium]|nr:site-specific DNA-methyltransferase [Acidimicrobiales bacterium]MXX42302.1 site-specific DNA-methyltransferase [Acidimicrobiales bacterium]MYB80370.1 site-specific DNA-methyltransferase [Acidimicrobiales bacterium]MYD32725.1 site-specific DNA-methyltransferase [Acidimicrobiales bacterium]MYI08784.1 site-specific DNA-methyltransferase [Acidimicrobiales bacterium]
MTNTGSQSSSPHAECAEFGVFLSTEAVAAKAPVSLLERARDEPQRAFPTIAKEPEACSQIAQAVSSLPTGHRIRLGDSRRWQLEPESVELAVTSPPYWTLKKYNDRVGQLGEVEDYDEFLDQLDLVWRSVYRALVPGGRMVVVVGDVNVSRRAFGRHLVFPLHASIQERCRLIGFDNLAPIIWYKIANAQYEMGPGGFYGKPYEPNGVIKNDIEYILLQRKPGGYRKPDLATRLMSVLSAADHAEWFQQVWRIGGASTRDHPAPFPVGLAERLIRMFSFAGDTVLDPFLGTGTTAVAAAACARNSIGCEVDPAYFDYAVKRVRESLNISRQEVFDLSA